MLGQWFVKILVKEMRCFASANLGYENSTHICFMEISCYICNALAASNEYRTVGIDRLVSVRCVVILVWGGVYSTHSGGVEHELLTPTCHTLPRGASGRPACLDFRSPEVSHPLISLLSPCYRYTVTFLSSGGAADSPLPHCLEHEQEN